MRSSNLPDYGLKLDGGDSAKTGFLVSGVVLIEFPNKQSRGTERNLSLEGFGAFRVRIQVSASGFRPPEPRPSSVEVLNRGRHGIGIWGQGVVSTRGVSILVGRDYC